MITGTVNADCEAVILLVVVGPNRQQRTVDGVIDTGFSGDLTLPTEVIALLGLTWLGREPGILADGSTDLFDVLITEGAEEDYAESLRVTTYRPEHSTAS